MPVPGESTRRYYPGMVPMETKIWRAFLREHELDFDAFEYDVAVGEGVLPDVNESVQDPALHERLRRMYQDLTRKRIDVLARRGDEWFVIEVEERASFTALGQVLGYITLLAQSRPDILRATPMVVARYVGPDDLVVLEAAHVLVFGVELPAGDK